VKKAFTLIELLVVIAIIAILASLLLPTLARSKAKAQAADCIGNFKQMNLAWHLYNQDNEDRLPPNVREGVASPDPPERWVGGSMYYETHPFPPDRFPDATNSTLLIEAAPGRIGPYLKTPAVFKCPGDKSYIILGGQKHTRVRSYSMNYYMGLYDQIPFQEKKYTRLSSLDSPSDRWVFIDEHEDCIISGQFSMFLIDWPKQGWQDFPAARHSGSASSPLQTAT
jgi:prepilin-type N-terminal cleavage/methylation domain-containing protein